MVVNIPLIEAQGVGLDRDRRPILRDVSFTLHGGEMVALMGRNGAGKTTLLRALLGLLPLAQGEVRIEGRRLRDLSRRQVAQVMAYVPQSHHVHFSYRVADVVALGRIARGGLFSGAIGATPQDRDAAQQALARLNVAHLAPRDFTALSGGERQAVLLARALVQGAKVLVLDEPEAGLDWGQQQRLSTLLRDLAAQGYLVLATTHDPDRTRESFSRALLLRDGRLWADGPARDLLHPARLAALYDVAS